MISWDYISMPGIVLYSIHGDKFFGEGVLAIVLGLAKMHYFYSGE
jgi:hypothetical protein